MKQNRFKLNVNQNERKRLLQATIFIEMTLSTFLKQITLEKANTVIRKKDIIILSDIDRDLFLNALENPSKPSKHLRQAFKAYQKAR